MSLHYLDPESEPRECHHCEGVGGFGSAECRDCKGTGRLGIEGARAEIAIEFLKEAFGKPVLAGFYYQLRDEENTDWYGSFKTNALALKAARAAHREAK